MPKAVVWSLLCIQQRASAPAQCFQALQQLQERKEADGRVHCLEERLQLMAAEHDRMHSQLDLAVATASAASQVCCPKLCICQTGKLGWLSMTARGSDWLTSVRQKSYNLCCRLLCTSVSDSAKPVVSDKPFVQVQKDMEQKRANDDLEVALLEADRKEAIFQQVGLCDVGQLCNIGPLISRYSY